MKSNNHSQQNFRRDGFLGLTGRKVNLLDRYEKKLEDLEDNLRKEQNLLAGEVRGISSQCLNLIII
jgi:ATP-dependent protease HslVU (ClpYQ) peptidase subunit